MSDNIKALYVYITCIICLPTKADIVGALGFSQPCMIEGIGHCVCDLSITDWPQNWEDFKQGIQQVEAAVSNEILIATYQNTRYHITEDSNIWNAVYHVWVLWYSQAIRYFALLVLYLSRSGLFVALLTNYFYCLEHVYPPYAKHGRQTTGKISDYFVAPTDSWRK
jgi:hypothetical protein